MNLNFYRIFALLLILAGFQTAYGQFTNRLVEAEPENVTVLHNNGEFRTGATSESGVAAPEGFVWSENQHDTGDLTVANSVWGYGTTFPQVRLADNFTVPEGQTWIISSVTVWGFNQGWTGSNSPFSGGTLQIWNGVPGESGSSVIFGDLTTDRLLSSTASDTYVIFNSVAPAPGNTPNTQRRLWENKLSIAPTLRLGPGTYWIDFATTTFNGVTTTFHRNVISPGNRTQAGWDGRQYVLSTDSWEPLVDGGLPSSAPDVPQDIAFKVNGTISGGNTASKFGDFDGDGKMDFGVTRWAASVVDPSEWFILKSGGSNGDYDYNVFGVRAAPSRFISGVGIADIVLPEDYDGDGKADIAIWRNGQSTAEPQSYFYIINSSDSTVSILPFGTRNDIAYLPGDYDGDGKADLAVWRPGTNPAPQSTFYVLRSSDGQLMAADFGLRTDRPVLGDFDGDGKQDFSVMRINTAINEATLIYITKQRFFYENHRTSISIRRYGSGRLRWRRQNRYCHFQAFAQRYGLDYYHKQRRRYQRHQSRKCAFDIPVQGDYNGDGKTQIAVYRKTGTGSANPSTFWVRQEDGSYTATPWGNGFDFPIAGRLY